jgi:uncharacterized protein
VARPSLEVADVFRFHGQQYKARQGKHLHLSQLKVISAIEACRTAKLGGHQLHCAKCETDVIAYNSCRNRHCTKCQASSAKRWLEARQTQLLPVDYYHVVQTCEIFISTLANVVSLGFTIQTNGTLLSDEWIQALIDYNVDVGVSIDGPAIYNDMYRIDKKGKGTHAAVVDGIGKLNAKFKQGQLRPISQISVINAHFNYYTVLKHLLTELSINRLSFLLPDINYDTGFPDKHTSETYGKIFCNIFDLWSESGDFEVRQVEEILRFFKNTVVSDTNRNDNNVVYENDYQILVIQSDATVALNDSWLTSLEWQQKVAKPHVTKISLKEYLGKPIFEEIREIYKTKPLECKSCKWLSVCGGGDIENRYSKENGFANKSIFCDGLKMFFEHITNFLLANGYPLEMIERKLGSNYTDGTTI